MTVSSQKNKITIFIWNTIRSFVSNPDNASMHNALYKMIKHRTLKTHIILNGFRHVSAIKMRFFFRALFIQIPDYCAWSIVHSRRYIYGSKSLLKLKTFSDANAFDTLELSTELSKTFTGHRLHDPCVDSLHYSIFITMQHSRFHPPRLSHHIK